MPGQRLHLDLTSGARADMIAGALVAVGAPVDAVRDALRAIGAGAVDVVVEPVKRAGLSATRVRFLVDGHDLCAATPDLALGRGHFARVRRAPDRHRHAVARPRFEDAHRGALEGAKSAAAVEDVPDVERFGAGIAVNDPNDKNDKKAARKQRARSPIDAWLHADDAVALDEAFDVVKRSDLAPIPKALALNALRRASDALNVVASTDARLHARAAAALVVEVVACAALVDALSPAAVTASALAISTANVDDGVLVDGRHVSHAWPKPSPFILELAAGVPTLALDAAHALVDVAGAAFVRACVHRFGARGVSTTTTQGLGAGAFDVAGGAFVVRALVGPPSPVRSRSGEKHVEPMCDLCARLPADLDRATVVASLSALGVRPSTIAFGDVVDDKAHRAWLVRACAPSAALEAVTALLWRHGAGDVTTTSAELHAPAVAEVTVPVGRGRTKMGVRVRVWKDGEHIARIEADASDVDAAAHKRGSLPGATHAIAAEAIAAFTRLADVRERSDDDDDDDDDDE